MDLREKIRNDLKIAGYDVLDNNVIDDLFIEMHKRLLSKTDEDLKTLKERKSIKDFEKLDEEDQRILAENFFVEINDGNKASGELRLFLRNPMDMFIPEGSRFETDGDIYVAPNSETFNANTVMSQMTGGFYYVDVLVESEEVGDFDVIETKEFDVLNNDLANIIEKAENPSPILGGTNEQSARQLYRTIQQAISVRNLANEPSASVILRNNFPTLRDVRIVGAGEEDMKRDIVQIDGGEARVGNKVDVWVHDGELPTKTVKIEWLEDTEINFGYSNPYLPDDIDEEYTCYTSDGEELKDVVIEIKKIIDGHENEIDFKFIQEQGNENSVRQRSKIKANDNLYHGECEITFSYSPLIPKIQNLLTEKETRLPLGDFLAKNFNIFRLYGRIEYIGHIEDAEEKLTNYIYDYKYNPHRGSKHFEISDLIDFLYSIGAQKAKMPLELFLVDESGQKVVNEVKSISEQIMTSEGNYLSLKENNIIEDSIKVYSKTLEKIFNITENDVNKDQEIYNGKIKIIKVLRDDIEIFGGYNPNSKEGTIKFEEEGEYKVKYQHERNYESFNKSKDKIKFAFSDLVNISYDYNIYEIIDEVELKIFDTILAGEILIEEV